MKNDKWIFILTNENSYKTVKPESRIIYNLRSSQPILQWDFEAIDPSANLSPGLYIVFDNYGEFNDHLKKLNKSKIFILTHTNCYWKIDKLLEIGYYKNNLQKGMHELNGKFYPEVIEILESGNSEHEVFEGVWDVVFALHLLEAKLEFLHLCLTIEGVNKALSDKLHEKIGLDENLVSELSMFSDPVSDPYIIKLTEIRDKVLADNLK
jgi:hypothetical protein